MLASLLAMNSLCFITTTLVIALSHFLISPATCSSFSSHPPRMMGLEDQGFLFEEKTRLGSTPPSCHNKCNQCHPCMAVQVPTLPSHDRVEPSLARKFLPTTGFSDLSFGSDNRYSNYKPLGWKCHCNGHFYNP